MTADIRSLLAFLEQQQVKQAAHFPGVKAEKVLSFMGTTSQPGTYAALSVHPIVRLEPASGSRALRVHLGGELPRRPMKGECVTVHITHADRFQGYQIKTPAVPAGGELTGLVDPAPGGVIVGGTQIFTVHHSPYTMKFFELIPYDEVEQIARGVGYALVGVGEQANISPRFIFHFESKLDRVVLYHGDGLALKTFMNLKQNRQETRLVLDLADHSGFALRGTVEEFQPHQHPEAYERVCAGFSAGSWGKPSRLFRFVAEQWTPIEPPRPRDSTAQSSL